MTAFDSLGRKHTLDHSDMSCNVFVQKRKAQKIVREIYLRKDIPCSSKLCFLCRQTQDHTTYLPILEIAPNSSGNLRSHYLVPDTNVFYHCIDIMEHFAWFCDVIVLQTVLEELHNKNINLYNRLRQLISNPEKRYHVFNNYFFSETHIRRTANESINDYNDRAIRVAALWYKNHLMRNASHLTQNLPDILLITDDRDNRGKAKMDGLITKSVNEYFEALPKTEDILDMISRYNDPEHTKTVNLGNNIYDSYLGETRLLDGIKNGELHKGIFDVSQFNYLEATVNVPRYDKSVCILGKLNFNRAIQGDLVVIQILPRNEWKILSGKLDSQEASGGIDTGAQELDENVEAEVPEMSANESARQEQPIYPTAKVVGILRSNRRSYVGHICPAYQKHENNLRSAQSFLFQPSDKRVPRIRFKSRQGQSLLNQKIIVAIDQWDRASRVPEGHYVRSLGMQDSKEAETEALLIEWDIQYRPFTKAVIACLPLAGSSWTVPKDSAADPAWINRADLRALNICSIDPPGCQDIDDALHARLLKNGNIEVGVHIADVSTFVQADTAMDSEAALRGTTVYMVDKRIDMLPMLLGTNLCSLMPNVERFAFSVIWELSQDGQIIGVQFTKSVIRSSAAFSYEDAQNRLDNTGLHDDLTQGMRLLLSLAKKLRAKRLSAGALNLASPEVKIEMDSETSDPIDVQNKQPRETNSLVEEFMLLANISVAQKIYAAYPEMAMLRRHAAPPSTRFEGLQDILMKRCNMTLHVESSKALADSLDECAKPEEPFFNTLVRIMATRCMLSAEYFSSGQFSASEYKHYGLASDIYTHFTSPIRRYADVIAHRQLSSAIGFEPLHPSLQSQAKLSQICENINYRHRMAQMAGRASVEYYVGQALKGKTLVEEAFVMKVFSNGFVVFVARFGVEGVIHLPSDPDLNRLDYRPDLYELVIIDNQEKERRIAVFDKVKVTIQSVLEEASGKRKIRLELYD